MNLSEMQSATASEGGFDTASSNVSTATITRWINSAYRELVVQSRWRVERVTVGTTISGTSTYAAPANVAFIEAVRVGDADYDLISEEGLWYGRTGTDRRFSFRAGTIDLYPTPTGGLEITALAVMSPVALANPEDTPIVPIDLHERIVDGAIAMGLERVDESDSSQVFEARFRSGILELRRRRYRATVPFRVEMA